MIARCEKTYSTEFKNYGARGIKVCAEWHDFGGFHRWATNAGYARGLTIERVDNDGGYHPGNCKWATYLEQAINKRNIRRSPDGTPWSSIALTNGIPRTTFNDRVFRGWSDERAATAPVRKK